MAWSSREHDERATAVFSVSTFACDVRWRSVLCDEVHALRLGGICAAAAAVVVDDVMLSMLCCC